MKFGYFSLPSHHPPANETKSPALKQTTGHNGYVVVAITEKPSLPCVVGMRVLPAMSLYVRDTAVRQSRPNLFDRFRVREPRVCGVFSRGCAAAGEPRITQFLLGLLSSPTSLHPKANAAHAIPDVTSLPNRDRSRICLLACGVRLGKYIDSEGWIRAVQNKQECARCSNVSSACSGGLYPLLLRDLNFT